MSSIFIRRRWEILNRLLIFSYPYLILQLNIMVNSIISQLKLLVERNVFYSNRHMIQIKLFIVKKIISH